jgi:hypothetical protein
VRRDRADSEDELWSGEQAVGHHARAVRRAAEVAQHCLVQPVVLVDREATVKCPELPSQLDVGHSAVGTLGGQNGDALVRDAGRLQLGDHVPQYARNRRGSGAVIDQDEYAFRRTRDLA